MKELPQVVLLVRSGEMENEERIALTIRSRGYTLGVIRTLPELADQIEREGQNAVVVVHLSSLLNDQRDISGYDQFLHVYGRLRRKCNMKLIVINPSIETREGCFVGYGDLVTVYLTEPVEVEVVLTYIDRVAADLLKSDVAP